MNTVKNIARFLIVVAVLWTQVVRAAAYDPKPVSYTGVVADTVQVIRDPIMDGVDDFIITATKGKTRRIATARPAAARWRIRKAAGRATVVDAGAWNTRAPTRR